MVFTVAMETEQGAARVRDRSPPPQPRSRERGGDPRPPQRVALTGHVPPAPPGERPPCRVRIQGDVLLPAASPCHGDTLVATAEEPQEVPVTTTEEPREVWAEVPVEQPRQVVPRGSCLIRDWQEERATADPDQALPPELGSWGFVHRHGHRGLLARQPLLRPPLSTTAKHAFRPPHSITLPARGQREATLEFMLYQKYRQEMLEETCPPHGAVEMLSTTHRDYRAGGFQPTPLPPTQPHNYHTEQPRSFWLERARSVPGVTCIRTGDSPFRRNAAFSTPITEHLEQPLPHVAESCQLRPGKQ